MDVEGGSVFEVVQVLVMRLGHHQNMAWTGRPHASRNDRQGMFVLGDDRVVARVASNDLADETLVAGRRVVVHALILARH